MYFTKIKFFSFLILFGISFSQDDGCDLPDNNLYLTSDGTVLYNSTDDIGGFQFNVDFIDPLEMNITGASGGDATANGFMISSSATIVLGFSFTGSVIPAGCGTLVELELNGESTGLSGIIISDSVGGALDFEYYEPPISIDDGCDLPDNNLYLTSDGAVLYNSTDDIGGFQFNVDFIDPDPLEMNITGASGGDATANGFMISSSATIVLGFSFTGSVIPAGCGTLVELELNGESTGLSGIIISDSVGGALDFEYYEGGGSVETCDDDTACNYGEEGDCEYAEENYDCDGNCVVDVDCEGECGGDAIVDECGVCNGSGIPDDECDCNGNVDVGCGCGESGPSGCDEQCGSDLEFDECGECGGPGAIYECGCEGLPLGGDDITDGCDLPENNLYLLEDGTVLYNSTDDIGGFQLEIEGTTVSGGSGGDAEAVGFVISVGGSTVLSFSFTGAVIPAGCGTLVELSLDGEATGFSNFIISDAIGGALAFEYYEGVEACDCEGNSLDECDECGGDNSTCTDCNGVINGDAEEDDCGVCEGGNSSCSGCTDESAINYDPDATIDDDSCEWETTIDYDLDLHSGANLVSFYALPEDASLSNIMASLEGVVTGIIGEGVAASPNPVLGWVGSLSEIDPLSGYWVKVDQSSTLSVLDATPTEDAVYTLHSGANLISWPSGNAVEVGYAIPDDVEGNFIGIIGEGVAASPNPILGWVGSLSQFEGGKGYWAKVDAAVSFSFLTDGDARLNNTQTENNNLFNQSTGQAFYFIGDINLGDLEETANIEMVKAYNNNILVGQRLWNGPYTDVPAMGYDGSIETAGYCESGDNVQIIVLLDNGLEYTLLGSTPQWELNEIFTIETLTIDNNEVLPSEISIIGAYPNPFNPSTVISYETYKDEDINISIYNISGQLVSQLYKGYQNAGYHQLEFDGNGMSSGMYFIKINNSSELKTHKLLLMK